LCLHENPPQDFQEIPPVHDSHDSILLKANDPRGFELDRVAPVVYRCKEPRVNQPCAGVML